jgi:hypothetical protein
MGMTKTTGAIITGIVEAYAGRTGQWVGVGEIAERAGLTAEELRIGIEDLLRDEDFRADPNPLAFRVTEQDAAVAPVIGNEARQIICWY